MTRGAKAVVERPAPRPAGRKSLELREAVLPHRPAAAAASPACRRLLAQPRHNLPDGSEVIRRVRGRGEGGRSAHVVPIRAAGDDLSPSFGFVAQAVAERSPPIVGNRSTLPTAVPVGA